MKAEEFFGSNAGKVWSVLKSKGALTAQAIAKEAKIKTNDVYASLGWLGREGKIEIVKDAKGLLYKLI